MIINSLELKNGEIYSNVFATNYTELQSFGFTAEEAKDIWLIQAKKDAIKNVLTTSQRVRGLITDGADYARIAGWLVKESRARRVMVDIGTEIDVKQLEIEAQSRGKGETIKELATRQIFLSDQLALGIAFLDGYESFYIDSIENATKVSQIDGLLAEYNININTKLEETKNYNEL
jgi:hypothetical protein